MKRSRFPLLFLPPLAALLLALGLSLLAPGTGSAAPDALSPSASMALLISGTDALSGTSTLPAIPSAVTATVEPSARAAVTATVVPSATAAVTATVVPSATAAVTDSVVPTATAVATATVVPTATAAAALKDSGISILTAAPVVAGSPNTTFLIVNSPAAAPIREVHLTLDFWSRGVVGLHLPFTLTLQPGPNVFPFMWNSASFSPTFDARSDSFLDARWADSNGNLIDRAQRALNSFGADPLPALVVSADRAWDVGTITQGAALNLSFAVANAGAGDLAVYLAEPGTMQPYRKLAPGDMTYYTLTLDTLVLPPLPFSHTLTLRTSDPAAPVRELQLSGVIVPADGLAAVFAVPERPWDRRVAVYGSMAANAPVYFTDLPSNDSAPNEPCTLADAAAHGLQGVGSFCLDAAGSAFGSSNGGRVVMEHVDGPLFRLSLPQPVSASAAYDLHFGKLYSFGEGGGALSATVSVVSQTYAVASLDAFIDGAGNGSPVRVQFTVGNLLVYSQTQVITRPKLIHMPGFAGALNQYLVSQATTNSAAVPFQVAVDTDATVVLTNLSLAPARSVDLSLPAAGLALGFSPEGYTQTEGLIVPITATVHNSGSSDSGPVMVAFDESSELAAGQAPQRIGAVLVSNIPAGGSAPAMLTWDTSALSGVVTVTTSVDPYGRVTTGGGDPQHASAARYFLARPSVDVLRIVPADLRPYPGTVVPVSVVLRNGGQTDALSVTVALYESDATSSLGLLGRQVSGPLLAGTILIDSYRLPVAAGAEVTATLIWTPPRAGPRHLIAVVSANSATLLPAGPNHQAVLPVFVGFRGPILIDSGGPNDIAYTPTVGYGFLGADGGLGRVCGAESYHISRQASGGPLRYRLDSFQPGRTYHLDLTFGECDGAGRRQRVLVNGVPLLASVDLSDEQPHHYSLRLDPALYADSVVTVTIEDQHGGAALLSALHVYDVDYRDVMAGAPGELPYPGAQLPGSRAFGYLNGVSQTFDDAPGPAMRIITTAEELRYRFEQLDPARRYALNLTFYHRFDLTPTLTIALGRWYQSPTFGVPYGQPYAVNIAIPRGAYAADGSITVSISRTDIVSGAFVSEIALEEQTLGESFASADLVLLSLESPHVVTAGVPVTFTLLIVNNGPDVAADVVLNAPASISGLRLAGSAGAYCADAAHLSCALGEFPAGMSVPMSVVWTPSTTGSLAIPFSIDSTAADPNSANNSVLLSTQIVPAGGP